MTSLSLQSPVPVRRLANLLNDSIERMISIQMTGYPDHWSDEDRREMAIQHLGLSPNPSREIISD